ncbi:Hypothetical predicted protein, partial [Paramuricea clavata]
TSGEIGANATPVKSITATTKIENHNNIYATTITSKQINNIAGTIKAKFAITSSITTSKITNASGATIESDSIEVTEIENSGNIHEKGSTAKITASTSITNSANIGTDSSNLTITSPLITNNSGGTIKAKFAIPSGGVASIINKAIIEITAADKAMDITSYTGNATGELHILFSDLSQAISNPIINIATKATFASTSKIVLCGGSGITAQQTKTGVPLIKLPSDNSITIDTHNQTASDTILDSILYSKVFRDSNNGTNYAIIAKDIKYDKHTFSATLTVVATTTQNKLVKAASHTKAAAKKSVPHNQGNTQGNGGNNKTLKTATAKTTIGACTYNESNKTLTLQPGNTNAQCVFKLNSIPQDSSSSPIFSAITNVKHLVIGANLGDGKAYGLQITNGGSAL